MSNSCRRSLFFLLSLAAMMMFAGAAFAQECDTYCDPYNTYCSETCDRCTHQGIDGCDAWTSSTCGDEAGGCLAENCTPNWVLQSDVVQGTYDGRGPTGCNHHSMHWITITDTHYCNVNEYFYTHSYCQDVIDGSRSGFYPSCCDGVPSALYTCDGHHSCTG